MVYRIEGRRGRGRRREARSVGTAAVPRRGGFLLVRGALLPWCRRGRDAGVRRARWRPDGRGAPRARGSPGIRSCATTRSEGCGKLSFDARSASETTVRDAPNRRTRHPWPHRASPSELRFLRRVACFARLTTGGTVRSEEAFASSAVMMTARRRIFGIPELAQSDVPCGTR